MRCLTNRCEAGFSNGLTRSSVRKYVNGEEMTMSDGPSPDDFRAKVFRDRIHPGDWRVEKLCDDGKSIEVAIFSGGGEGQPARRYADREYGEFDEIELEPYQRSPWPTRNLAEKTLPEVTDA